MSTAAERYPHLYGSRAWKKGRRNYLDEHPLCEECHRWGRIKSSAEVDHIKKHGGNRQLFFDTSNWQALCAFCHRVTKARIERSGREHGCDADGIPLDPAHHWNAGSQK